MTELVLVLHNIRSVHNVGSILRTADCAGVSRVYLCGNTPAPTDRFGRKRKDLAKVALGAEESVPWEQSDSTETTLANLKKEGFHLAALEQHESAVPYTIFQPKQKTALVLGEEIHGIEEETLNQCDSIIEIPIRGKKESLNVSVAAGISIFRLVEQGT